MQQLISELKKSGLECNILHKAHQVIIAPEYVDRLKAVLNSIFPQEEKDVLSIGICEVEQISTKAISIFTKDGVFHKKFCLSCIKCVLKKATTSYYNPTTGLSFMRLREHGMQPACISFANFCEHDMKAFFPEVPLGALLYALVSEPSIASLVKAWVDGMVMETIQANPHPITLSPKN